MKLLVKFQVEKYEISKEYRRVFLHIIKDSLTSVNHGKYYNEFYNGTNTKNFTFSVFFDKPEFTKDRITLQSNQVKLLLSTSDKKTGFILYNCLLEKKGKRYPLESDNKIQLVSVRNVKEPEVNDNKILVKTSSPLVVRNHIKEGNKDYYYSFEREEFLETAKQSMKRQLLQVGFTEDMMGEISIQPLKCKKVIVAHYGCKIETTVGILLLEGSKMALSYFLKAGLCSRKSEGFGMLELLA